MYRIIVLYWSQSICVKVMAMLTAVATGIGGDHDVGISSKTTTVEWEEVREM